MEKNIDMLLECKKEIMYREIIMENKINGWTEKLELGHITHKPIEIKGGLLHKMYRVSTTKGNFAIKLLNREIMKRPEALQNMIHSEQAALLIQKEVPSVVALLINEKQVHELNGEYAMVYPWIEGKSVFPPEINEAHCEWVGDILGKIHHMDISVDEIKPEVEEAARYDWDKYLELTKKIEVSDKKWTVLYQKALEDIKIWNQRACDAQEELVKTLVISHRDLDPKNVMWQELKPFVIDWEAAGYINPYQELLEVICYWADDGKGSLKKSNFDALMMAYRRHSEMMNVEWNAVFNGSYSGMLGWLEYNIKRALGLEAEDEKERQLGKDQVMGTINALYQHSRKIELLKEWLEHDRSGN